MSTTADLSPKSSIDGLWVVVVGDEDINGDSESRIPVMARAGNDQTFLLGFKNFVAARQFVQASAIDDAEPQMVVSANKSALLQFAQESGAAGVLVDYNPTTQEYSSAASLY